MAEPASLVPTRERLLRFRCYSPSILPYILPLLRAEHATGRLILDLSQGSVCAVSFEERASPAENT